MNRLIRVGGTLALALAINGSASAAPPTLKSVDAVNRHPSATFSAPKAASATMYVATKPDRATDGAFVTQNIVTTEQLTSSDFHACYVYGRSGQYRPSCAAGYSNVVSLTVPPG